MESLVLFAASFYISWVLFAAVYYVICYAHGDFEYEDVATAKSANHTFCVLEIENFGENRYGILCTYFFPGFMWARPMQKILNYLTRKIADGFNFYC
jgi:hypothetical protein